jgi:hypothetical protein
MDASEGTLSLFTSCSHKCMWLDSLLEVSFHERTYRIVCSPDLSADVCNFGALRSVHLSVVSAEWECTTCACVPSSSFCTNLSCVGCMYYCCGLSYQHDFMNLLVASCTCSSVPALIRPCLQHAFHSFKVRTHPCVSFNIGHSLH